MLALQPLEQLPRGSPRLGLEPGEDLETVPRPSKPKLAIDSAATPPTPDTAGVVQVKVWLLGISPMVWRRLLVPDTCTLRELHGTIQVVMGWEGIHLYQFCLRSRCYGSWELSASSPGVTLATLKLRRGARFTYEYDLNIPWRHEVRIEESRLEAEPGKAYPDRVPPRGVAAALLGRVELPVRLPELAS